MMYLLFFVLFLTRLVPLIESPSIAHPEKITLAN